MLRVVEARDALARAVVLRRVVVVDLLLATGVTSTVAEEAAPSVLGAEPEAEDLAACEALAEAAEEADERRREAGVAMTMERVGMER